MEEKDKIEKYYHCYSTTVDRTACEENMYNISNDIRLKMIM